MYPFGAKARVDVKNVALAAVVTLEKTAETLDGLVVFNMITIPLPASRR